MELRQLRHFVILADELNFTRAAVRLNLAQSALSTQIARLEAEVGARLLVRAARNTSLTEAGRAFLEFARQSLNQADRAVTAARQAASGNIGELSIGYNNPAEFDVFRKVIPAFKLTYPKIHLTFHNRRNVELLDALRQDKVDLVFDWVSRSYDEYAMHDLVTEPIVALVPEAHPLAAETSIAIRQLSREPMILFPQSEMPEAFGEIEQLFLAAGAVLNVVEELDTPLSVINFVAMGAGCSLLPDYFRRIRCDGVVYVLIRPPTIVKTLAIIKKKDRGGLADSFYRFTIETMQSIGSGASGPGRAR